MFKLREITGLHQCRFTTVDIKSKEFDYKTKLLFNESDQDWSLTKGTIDAFIKMNAETII